MSELYLTPWKCPFCVAGLVGVVERCLHCHGTGLTDKPCGPAERAPRPPAVMRAACADCAFRQGSPELENAGVQLPEDEPFYCHQGLPVSATGAYTPVATFRGLPLGAMLCAGWWALRTGEDLPAREYREVPIDGEKQWGLPSILTNGQRTEEQREILLAAMRPAGPKRDPLVESVTCPRCEAPAAEMCREPFGPDVLIPVGLHAERHEATAAKILDDALREAKAEMRALPVAYVETVNPVTDGVRHETGQVRR